VTAHVAALEAEARRPLFVRLARGVAATPQAHALARDVAPHLDALEAVRHRVRGDATGATVHLGGPADMLAAKVLPTLAPLVALGVRLRVRTGIAEPLLEALAADELDLVVATRRRRVPRLRFERLLEEDFVLVGSPEWAGRLQPAAVSREPDAALADVPLVAFDEDLPLLRLYWRRVFGLALERPAAVVVPDLRAVIAAVAAGAGISVVPRYLAVDALAGGEVTALHDPDDPPTNPIHLAYAPARLERPGVEAVRRALLRAAPGWQRAAP
jgi:DNA-binding transcriptional LysR family regulator